MSILRRTLAAAISLATLTAAVTIAGTTAGADPAPSITDVRRATAKYHDPAVAVADGFIPTDECAAHPELGGMGLHYIHPARLADPAVVATEPEILLYEPLADGTLRLAGVEWFAADPDQDLGTDAGRPSLFDVPFDGPMPGHDGDMPVHFDLHAWIWKRNPAGQFAAWNPALRCDT